MSHEVTNETRGEVVYTLHGFSYSMRYTWKAIGRLKAHFGDEYDAEIQKALNNQDLEAISRIVSAALIDSHPEMTPEHIFEMSPPIIPLMTAADEALRLAFWGSDKAPKEDTAENQMMSLLTKLSQPFGRLFKSA